MNRTLTGGLWGTIERPNLHITGIKEEKDYRKNYHTKDIEYIFNKIKEEKF